MKTIFLFSLFITFAFNSFSHEYYFAFAEMEYNEKSKSFELSLIVSTHDIEHWLQGKGVKVKELENHYSDSIIQNEFGITLLNGFSISIKDSSVPFQITDYEVKKNGLTEFYFSSIPVEISSPLLVKFDLLMDLYSQQQNKLTFIYHSKKQTYPFLNTQREQKIELVN